MGKVFKAKFIGCIQRKWKLLFLLDEKYLKTKAGIHILHQGNLVE